MNATFIIRFKAFLIDYILIFAYLALLVVMNVFLFPINAGAVSRITY